MHQVLRNAFSAGEIWVGAPEERLGIASLWIAKDTRGSWDCEDIKAQGFLFRIPPWKHQLELLFYYLVVAPGLNNFRALDD